MAWPGRRPSPRRRVSPTKKSCAVVPNWIDRLGGADVCTLANAYQMVESLRIDYGQLGLFGIHP